MCQRKEGKFVVTAKADGVVSFHKNDKVLYDDIVLPFSDMELYLGHTQAPTSSKRDFDTETSHPFKCGYWFVAHNGVLTNYEQLTKKIKDRKKYNEVDSSIIPALLDLYSQKSENEVDIISKTLSLLEGTFGVWIYSVASGNAYIARSGSTIYANLLTNDFSSLPEKGFVELEQGIIYLMTDEGLTTVGSFTPNSPFFII
jgi:glucosamine 6-phosphate synthetase-like amidotransferase/phosphosugar isomerase protein